MTLSASLRFDHRLFAVQTHTTDDGSGRNRSRDRRGGDPPRRHLRIAGLPRADLERVAAYVAVSDRITVLTGPGISTESGIPDYRGPNGLWTTNPAMLNSLGQHSSRL